MAVILCYFTELCSSWAHCVYVKVIENVRKFTFAILSPGEFLVSYAVARPSVVCLSVTFLHPTQPVEIFGNVSTPFGTLVIL